MIANPDEWRLPLILWNPDPGIQVIR